MVRHPLVRLVVSLLGIALCFAPIAPLTAKNPFPKASESVQALSWGGHNHCTINSVNDKAYFQDGANTHKVGIWLTAAHCVAHEAEFTIAGHLALVIAVDVPNDLAVLATPDWVMPMLELATEAPDFGDLVEMWGHPLGWDSLIYVKGYISNPSMHEPEMERVDMWVALYTLVAAPGSSGSAVLNDRHQIVGVLQFSFSSEGEAFAPISGGVTYADLKAFLEPYLPEKN